MSQTCGSHRPYKLVVTSDLLVKPRGPRVPYDTLVQLLYVRDWCKFLTRLTARVTNALVSTSLVFFNCPIVTKVTLSGYPCTWLIA